jgi:hypothetical protein
MTQKNPKKSFHISWKITKVHNKEELWVRWWIWNSSEEEEIGERT